MYWLSYLALSATLLAAVAQADSDPGAEGYAPEITYRGFAWGTNRRGEYGLMAIEYCPGGCAIDGVCGSQEQCGYYGMKTTIIAACAFVFVAAIMCYCCVCRGRCQSEASTDDHLVSADATKNSHEQPLLNSEFQKPQEIQYTYDPTTGITYQKPYTPQQ